MMELSADGKGTNAQRLPAATRKEVVLTWTSANLHGWDSRAS